MFGTRRSSLTTASHNPTTGTDDRRLLSDEIFKLAGENSVLTSLITPPPPKKMNVLEEDSTKTPTRSLTLEWPS